MSTTSNIANDHENTLTTKSIQQTNTDVAPNENEVATGTELPKKASKDKLHFEEYMLVCQFGGEWQPRLRCQAWRSNGLEQCGRWASTKLGKRVCQKHGGSKGIGKRTPQGELNRLAATTKHGKLSKTEVAKVNKRVKEDRLLTKVAIALDLQKYPVRGEQLKAYPKPTLASLPALIKELEEL